jgi:indole-3-glycerol phosphate synthase
MNGNDDKTRLYMDILDKIIADKMAEVQERKMRAPVLKLEQSPYFGRQTYSLREKLIGNPGGGIIAEFKRKSPSRGLISEHADPVEVTTGHRRAGASALSVLTDTKYFAGSREDILKVRETNPCPILRKDFLIDEYQVLEALAWGADVILLIAAVLESHEVRKMAALARSVGLETLLEVHCEEELDRLNEHIDMVGVNNRDLKKMETDVNTSLALSGKIPADFVKVSESGISDPVTIGKLRDHGYNGFLIGEYFMQSKDPAAACGVLIDSLKLSGTD